VNAVSVERDKDSEAALLRRRVNGATMSAAELPLPKRKHVARQFTLSQLVLVLSFDSLS